MKTIIGICLVLFGSSAQGQNEVCRATNRGIDICQIYEKSTTTITRVRKGDPSPSDGRKSLVMEFDRDTTIASNAFSTLNPTSVRFEMPYITERNKSALHTLTLHPDSLVGLSNAYSIFVMHANINLSGQSLNSLANLKWFRFMYCGFTEVPTEMLESTPNLDELSFESNYIETIRPNAFLPLKNLRELHLENNGIVSLELGCFNGLDNLQVLDVSDNHFTAVPDIFNGLNKLRRLDVDNAFDDNGFKLAILRNVPAVTNLGLGNNNITSLPPDMFDVVPQLVTLSLFKNHITSVPKGVFDKLKSLKVLHLAQNSIETIEPGAFSGLNMNYLYLLDNKEDKIIETGTFSNLIVKGLVLRDSKILEVKPRAFDGLSADEIDLSENKLKHIGTEDFSGLTTEELDLSDNEIETIAPNAFKNTKVKRLRLGKNPISMGDKENWGLPASTEILTSSRYGK